MTRYRIRSRHRNEIALFLAAVVLGFIFFGGCTDTQAAGFFSFGDVEKPAPEFVRSGSIITAKFIPRAKSTSVTIAFEVTAGGALEEVKGVDFAAVDRPEVDVKNFKSAVFEVVARTAQPGGTATLSVRSDFFSLSTAFYIFNPHRDEPWMRDAQSENRPLNQRVRELVIKVKDGGDFDTDGRIDGHVSMIGGPRDSFWGYALGTLFIRFFGIFAVLVILMVGMIVSGRIFKALDRRSNTKRQPVEAAPAASQPAVVASGKAPDGSSPPSEAAVAAIAAAVYLRERGLPAEKGAHVTTTGGDAWIGSGRQRIMNDRLMVFQRAGRNRP